MIQKSLRALAVAAFAFAAAMPAMAQQVRVVLKGHDPVSYFTDGKPMQGEAKYSYDFDGERYYFASEKHKDMFAKEPERYMPQFSGYCTGSMARGVRNEGNPEAWVIMDGRLYVFGAPDSATAAKHKLAAESDLEAFRVKVAAAAKNFRAAR